MCGVCGVKRIIKLKKKTNKWSKVNVEQIYNLTYNKEKKKLTETIHRIVKKKTKENNSKRTKKNIHLYIHM